MAALVNDSVLLMAPFTCGELPVQSAVMLSPCGQCDKKPDGFPDVNAIIIDPIFKTVDAVRERTDSRTCQALGVAMTSCMYTCTMSAP